MQAQAEQLSATEASDLRFTDKRLVRGLVTWAYPMFTAWDRERQMRIGLRQRGAKAAGVSYERKVLEFLERSLPGHTIVGSLPFRYQDDYGWRFCVPDYLIWDFKQRRVTVVEVKLKHTGAASLELERLYVPVVRQALACYGFWVQQLEICRWYYPGVERTELVRSLPRFISAEHRPPSGVYVWSGRR